MDEERIRPRRQWKNFGWMVPGGLLIGMGIGWIFGHLVEGLLIGLGVGILAAGITRTRMKVG